MAYTTIILSLLLVAGAYLFVSIRDKSYINVFTSTTVFLVPTTYLLELLHVWQFGPSNSIRAYLIFYSCQAGFIVASALAYVSVRTPTIRLPFDGSISSVSRLPAYFLFALGFALYLPILIEFRDSLLDPRYIYAQTRIGYGLNFYLSTMLSYLALILLFFSKARRVELVAFTVACMVFQWLHGSKGQILTLFFIILMHQVYVNGKTASLRKMILFGLIACLLGIGLFAALNLQLLLGGLEAVGSYSDYARNSMMVVDSDVPAQLGRLTLENQIFPRMPRLLFPDKPMDFGDFYLAKIFFPDAFAGGEGAPAFANGTWIADFGVVAVPVLLVLGFLHGLMLRTFVSSLREHRSPGQFILTLYACNITVLPVGIGSTFLLPEYLVLALAANTLMALRLAREPTTIHT